MPLSFTIKILALKDDSVEWVPYMQTERIICNRFPLSEWHKIVADFNSDEEWHSFLAECKDYAQCYVLYRCRDNMPIAFSYYIQEDEKGQVVSIHGGAWGEKNTLLYYRGFIILIQALFDAKIKVRTACLKNNKIAERFIRSVGFVQYKETSTQYHFWINRKRLINSLIYKRIY